jgi:hypothetical protein
MATQKTAPARHLEVLRFWRPFSPFTPHDVRLSYQFSGLGRHLVTSCWEHADDSPELMKDEDLLTTWATISFSRWPLLCGVSGRTVTSSANASNASLLKSELKGKAIPVRGRGGLEGCEMLRIPHCLDNRLIDGGKINWKLYVRPRFRANLTWHWGIHMEKLRKISRNAKAHLCLTPLKPESVNTWNKCFPLAFVGCHVN